MNKTELNDLHKVGLTEGESKVYISLLKLGTSTVGPIMKESGVAHSNVYSILQRLIKKGIVSFIIKKKTKYFQAANPLNLYKYLDKKEEEIEAQKKSLQRAMPNLVKLQEHTPSQEAEIFVGIKGMRIAFEKLLLNLEKDEEDMFFYVYEEELSDQVDLFYLSIRDLLKNVKQRGIASEKSKKLHIFKKAPSINMRHVEFPIPGNIEICRDKILFITWGKEPISLLVHSEDMSKKFRQYFESVWMIAK